MKLMVTDDQIKIIENSEKIVGVSERTGNYIELDELIGIIDDLVYEYHCLEEQFDDLKRDMEENYELVGYDPRDYYDESDFH